MKKTLIGYMAKKEDFDVTFSHYLLTVRSGDDFLDAPVSKGQGQADKYKITITMDVEEL